MQVTYKGKSYGEWDEENLPRLAKRLGVSVDDIIGSTEDEKASSVQSDYLKSEFKNRLGPQAKINAVTANVSAMSLMLSLTILKAVAGSDEMEAIIADLNALFPDADGQVVPQLMGMHDKFVTGDVKTPVAALGLTKVIEQALFCGNEAHDILVETAQRANNAKRGAVDPVTG